MSNAVLPDDIARVIADPKSYAEWDNLHRILIDVRRDLPFARATLADYNPFWVATKYEDIQNIARQNTLFLSGMGGLQTKDALEFQIKAGTGRQFRSVVAMNQPEHMKYRMLTQAWFMPKNLKRIEDRLRKLARTYVDKLAASDGACDFVSEIAVHYPLRVIMSILGVPEEDEPLMLRLTQEYFGNSDAELNRGRAAMTPLEAEQAVTKVVAEFNDYFRRVSDDRRRNPTDDLATVIANSTIDGEPIADIDAMGYYITVAFAGHDTTSSSVSGALWALCECPEQLAAVQSNSALIPGLVEEAVRWTSPIHQFVRRAAADCEFRGQTVHKGDWVVLLFPSGNRDEEIFEAPFEFRVDRSPLRQIGFGYGAHVCLGQHLARMEMAIFFEELLPRLKSIELAGIPRRTVTNFVGGPKSLPIRFEMRGR
jgi:cytochrome P450